MEKPIEIRPLTLLFGKNGSGKSSFLKAMSFLSQNLVSEALKRTVYQISDETLLGNFNEVVLNNDIGKKIEIEIEEIIGEVHYGILATFSYNEANKNLESLVISNYQDGTELIIEPNKKNTAGIEYLNNSRYSSGTFKEFNEWEKKQIFETDHVGLRWLTGDEEYFYSPSITFHRRFKHPKADVRKFFENIDSLPIFDSYSELFRSKYFKYELKKNDYLSEDLKKIIPIYYEAIPRYKLYFLDWFKIESIRMKPEYKYKMDKFGNFSNDAYYGIIKKLDKLQTKDKFKILDEMYSEEIYDSFENFLKEQLKELGLGINVEIWKDDEKNFGGIYLIDSKGVKINLAEASSGLLQILPILFKSYFLYRDDIKYFIDTESPLDNPREGYPIIMLEQPELHLHPSLQTKFAEFLSQSRSNFIIETHSEHIVRKIQVLIAQGKLKKEKVAVYYFDKDKKTGTTSIKEMELDERGRFKEDWPDGFFDTDVQNTLDFFRALNKN
jgi:predicted ATPase